MTPLTLALVALLLGSLRAQDTISDQSKVVTMQLPAGWKLDPQRQRFGKLEDKVGQFTIIEFAAIPPGINSRVLIKVGVQHEVTRDVLSIVRRGAVAMRKNAKVKDVAVHEKPQPFVTARDTTQTKFETIMATAYRRDKGRILMVTLQSLSKHWDVVKPGLFELVKNAKLSWKPWPVAPKGRKEKRFNGVVLSSTKAIKKPVLRELEKSIKAIDKAVTDVHGAVKRSSAEPLRVYVNEMIADHKLIAESKEVRAVVREPYHLRLFTIPLGERGSKDRTEFASALAEVMLAERYSVFNEPWFRFGEAFVFAQFDATKRRLPTVRKRLLDHLKITSTFQSITEKRAGLTYEFTLECFGYIALFHAGPKQYQEAYRAFLAELRATYDLAGAAKKHLLSLDQRELREAAQAFVKKLRGVRVKGK